MLTEDGKLWLYRKETNRRAHLVCEDRKREMEKPKMTVQNLNLFYGSKQALKNIGMEIRKNTVTALIGPSGCGKSTF